MLELRKLHGPSLMFSGIIDSLRCDFISGGEIRPVSIYKTAEGVSRTNELVVLLISIISATVRERIFLFIFRSFFIASST